MKNKKRNYSNANEYLEALREEIKGVDMEALDKQIEKEFSQGDFSSLDPNFPSPDFWKAIERDNKIWKEARQKRKKEEKSKKSPFKKRRLEKTVSV